MVVGRGLMDGQNEEILSGSTGENGNEGPSNNSNNTSNSNNNQSSNRQKLLNKEAEKRKKRAQQFGTFHRSLVGTTLC